MIAIIDYGMGNLRSVQKAFEYLGYEAVITDSADVIASASHVILPGVGAFEDAMNRIRETQLDQALYMAANAGKPVLGICLGMQMMFEHSEENGFYDGLGLFPGTVTRFEDRGLKIPHMGWNTLQTRDCPLFDAGEDPCVYFVHSYCMADLLHACRALLCGEEEYICGDVRGFLEDPFAITAPVTVTKEEMIQSAKRLPAEGWLPRSVIVGSSILGTADWLRAALAVLCGEDSATVSPDGWQIDLDQFAELRDLNLKLTWVDTKNMMDNYVSRRNRLQSWTLRLPEGCNRKY